MEDSSKDTSILNANPIKYEKLHELLDRTKCYSSFVSDSITSSCGEIRRHPKKKKRFISMGSNTSNNSKKTSPPSNSHGQIEMYEDFSNLITNDKCKLRSYQVEGIKWLTALYENGINGILADEMGLGKTIQIILLLAYLRSNLVYGPFLIVAPLSTLQNWINEINKWCSYLPTVLFHGNKDERSIMKKVIIKQKIDSEFPILITSYDIVMNDKSFFNQYLWKLLIVDEGHRLKNFDCKLIRELKRMRSENRLLLTGTPLQNNLSELWSLMNFILPTVFDDLEKFQKWFDFSEKSIENQNGQNELIVHEREHQIITKLHSVLRPFVLRRLKKDVEKNIPLKREVIVYTGLSKFQRDLYRNILERNIYNGIQLSFQNITMQLRKVCNHPLLINSSDYYDINELLVNSCGKMAVLDQMCTRLRKEGHKTLIFSQMTKMLDILEDYFQFKNILYTRIDGSVAGNERQSLIDSFNSNPDIFCFLLSTRAGGLGINLYAADTVIIYDSDWNPFQDIQAQDRCHRIGQEKSVLVFRFITRDSIEINMLNRATSKRKLDDLVIGKGHFKTPLNKDTIPLRLEEMLSLFNSRYMADEIDSNKEEINYDKLLSRNIISESSKEESFSIF